MKSLFSIFCLGLLLFATSFCARGSSGEDNLLDEKKWQFYRTHVKGAVESSQSGEELTIRKTDRDAEDHVWWWQKAEATEGEKYRLVFEAKADGAESHSIYVGVEFQDRNGKFLEFKEVKKIGYVNPKFPSATVPDIKEWKTFEGDFTVPRGAAFYSVRLALGGGAPAEGAFRKVRVTKAATALSTVLERLPEEIPVQAIDLVPVSAGGVTLTPNWQLQGAERVESKTRQRICLNGLWAVQPANKNEPPKSGDWAFLKVPHALHNGNPYLVYGQAKTSWKKKDLFSEAESLWLLRDIEIPTMADSKIGLQAESFRGYALVVYWNGKRVGFLTNQLGGELDLSSIAKPGEKGQLALYALAVPPEGQYAYLMEAGKMERQYDATRFAKEPNRSLYVRGLSDTYLQIRPKQSAFDALQMVPSARNGTIEVWSRAPRDGRLLEYAVTITGADGGVVFSKEHLKAETRGEGWSIKVPWPNAHFWTPDDPYLYKATVRAVDAAGKVVDETLPMTFGFREVWVDGKQLMLNGRPLRLRPRLANSAYMDRPSLRRHFSYLKDMGFNCLIRPWTGSTEQLEAYEQQSRADFYDTADEIGFFVIPYTPYSLVSRGQFGTEGSDKADLDALMCYLRENQMEPLANHPSVIAYSGFGAGYSEGINYINPRPDVWGVSPLGREGVLDRILSSPDNRRAARERITRSADYVRRVKALDSTRPFLSHIDGGEADGWGIFDYFNWTPVQEWEDWPAAWAKEGVMPIGSTEHGLPYPASFLNHAVPDGDSEPWVTEYSAMILGSEAYARETSEYLELIRSSYNKKTGIFPPKGGAHHRYAELAVSKNWENVQAVWAANNRRIYRAWRTYGVPMGIEPFGLFGNLVDPQFLKKGDAQIVAQSSQELRTTGAKLDRWFYFGYWPSLTMPELPESPTGRKPEGLTPLGETLYEVNSPLLVYVAGSPERVTSKDHVFVSGETITKQVAVVWDGFGDRELEIVWKVRLNEKIMQEGREVLALKGGEIHFIPVKVAVPTVLERAEGVIEVTASEVKGHKTVGQDSFAFQVYSPLVPSEKLRKAKIVLLDPVGESAAAFSRLGLKPTVIASLAEWTGGEMLVVGRGALSKVTAQSLERVPKTVPIFALEQTSEALESIGLRTYPMRTRTVFPLSTDHPVLKGIGAPDLCDWRVEPKLLAAGVEPLRNGYNFHTNYYGTVASVTIETPTRGNFTPLLQNGFDLRETPLLEAMLNGRNWIFFQLSVVDPLSGVSPERGDPVGSRLLVNGLDYLLGKSEGVSVSFGVLGDAADVDLTRELGLSGGKAIAAGQLSSIKVAWIGKSNVPAAALRSWVEQGGTALVLPQSTAFYTAVVPEVTVKARTASVVPLPGGNLGTGLSQADFHYRQPLSVLTFNGESNVAEIVSGKGRWILVGFDPRRLNLKQEPYLRLTYRHQCRVLSQILTNLGVELELPGRDVDERFRRAPFKIDLIASAQARIKESEGVSGDAWVMPQYDDASWSSFGLSGQTATFGEACVRIRFTVPKDSSTGNLIVDLGTIDDYDETWLNGTKIGSITPDNSQPEQAYKTPRLYAIPPGLLKPGVENVLAIRSWNRNAARGASTQLRGPMTIRTLDALVTPYVGDYKHSDDPYMQYHW